MTDGAEWGRTVPAHAFLREPASLDETALSESPAFLDEVRSLAEELALADLRIRTGTGTGRGPEGPRQRTLRGAVLWLVAVIAFATSIGAVFARSRPDNAIALPIVAIALAVGVIAATGSLLPLRTSSPPSWALMFAPGLGTAFGALSLIMLAGRESPAPAAAEVWWVIGIASCIGAGILTAVAFLVRAVAPRDTVRRIDDAPRRAREERAALRRRTVEDGVGRLRTLWDALPAAERDRIRSSLDAAAAALADRRLIAAEPGVGDHLPGLLILEGRLSKLPDDERIDPSVVGIPRPA